MPENKISEIKKWFGTPERPVALDEFKEFWDSLTDTEKDELKKAELK